MTIMAGAIGMVLGYCLALIVFALRDDRTLRSIDHMWEFSGYQPRPSAEPQGAPPTGGSGLLPPPPGPTPPDFEGSQAQRDAALARWRDRCVALELVRGIASYDTIRKWIAEWNLDDRLRAIEARMVEIVESAAKAQEK